MGTVEKRDKHKKRRFVSPEEKLERELKEDYEKLERLNDRLADSQNIQNKEQFKYGFAMGVLLMKEVYEHPEFKPKE